MKEKEFKAWCKARKQDKGTRVKITTEVSEKLGWMIHMVAKNQNTSVAVAADNLLTTGMATLMEALEQERFLHAQGVAIIKELHENNN